MSRAFRFMYVSDLLSTVGTSFVYIAIYWLSAEQISASGVALLATGVFLIRFLVSTFVGPWIDRFVSASLYQTSLLIRLLALGITLVGIGLTDVVLPWLLGLLVVQTILQIVGGNAVFTWVVDLVEDDQLPQANAYLATIERIGTLSGFLLGGMMVAHFSIASILWLDLGLHLVAWLLVRHMTGQVAEGARVGSYREALLEGVHYVARDGRLKWILGCAILANWMITPMNTLLAPYAKNVLSGNAQTFSALELATVIGGITMSLLYGKWVVSIRQDKLFRIAVVLQGLAIAIVAYMSSVPLAIGGFVLLGMALTLFGIPFATLLQRSTPAHLLGRVRTAMVAASTACSALCYGLSSYLTSLFNISFVFLLFSLSGLVLTAIWLLIHRNVSFTEARQDKVG
ncbi:MFS transporter [Exiguobacterium acetylicum]|uniref:MFS transporter n=1 Tax=Exiguobacterium acetylicum TaxID=41170 RepID=UPI0027DF748E|nr:MFS transporter [Exiguobacterium acetylicum]MDQ6466635.1 MFS transporter [Exiguobacterium acetylicum]